MISLKKLFTLIELIVVIVVLSVLAAIVIPNISNMQEDAKKTSIISNVRNLQTSSDMYSLKQNGDYPTFYPPELGLPSPINFKEIHPKYLRDLPKVSGIKYWIDYRGKVWASTVDSPTSVKNTEDSLTWDTVEDAKSYFIYEVLEDKTVQGAISNSKYELKFLEETSSVQWESENGKRYAVSAIDEYDFESPPTIDGYIKYNDLLVQFPENIPSDGSNNEGKSPNDSNDETNEEPAIEHPIEVNHAPIAVITISPEQNIKTDTTLSITSIASSDEDGDSIQSIEWTIDGVIVQNPPTSFTSGQHTIKLRIQDSKGEWSQTATRTIDVAEASNSYIVQTGQYVKYGTYNGQPLIWRVVGKSSSTGIMLFLSDSLKKSDGSYDNRYFDYAVNSGEKDNGDRARALYGSNNWERSDIRAWLNGTFYNSLPNKDKVVSVSHKTILNLNDQAEATSGSGYHIENVEFSTVLQNYNTAYSKNVTDKVYLVSIGELKNIIHPAIGNAYYNSGYSYWLRDARGDNQPHLTRTVAWNGQIGDGVSKYTYYSIRPALNLSNDIVLSGTGTASNPYTIK